MKTFFNYLGLKTTVLFIVCVVALFSIITVIFNDLPNEKQTVSKQSAKLVVTKSIKQHTHLKRVSNQTHLQHQEKTIVAGNPQRDMSDSSSIDAYLKSLNFNGTALVVKGNHILINKGYGYSDFVNKIPNHSQTKFLIGSITKVFVSTAIMQLQEQGRLSIKDSLSKYIPDFPNGNKITLYHLLTHTSGIPEHTETSQLISHRDLIKKIELGHLKFQPGSDWFYSDSNYSILAYILEKVTNQSLTDYLNKNIFQVAGMTNTGFGDTYYNQPNISKGYRIHQGMMTSPSLPNMSQLFGCGDIYTTPYDMYLFDKSLYEGKLLSAKSLKVFFTPFKHNYALGLYRDPSSYADHGVLPGWNVLNSFGLNGKVFVVLFSNVENGVKSFGLVNSHIYGLVRDVPEPKGKIGEPAF